MSVPPGQWAVRISGSDDSSERLLCIPHAGAGASAFNDWRGCFPDALEVLAVRLPARESRFLEPALITLDATTRSLLEVVELLQEDGKPLALFGQCSGATIAYALTGALEECGHSVKQLFVSAQKVPTPVPVAERIAALPSAEFRAHLGALGGVSEEILADEDMMDMLEDAIRADFAVTESFDESQHWRLACPLTAIRGSGDATVSDADLAQWQELTSGPLEGFVYEGGHFPTAEEWRQVAAFIAARS